MAMFFPFHVGKTMSFLPSMTGNGKFIAHKNGDDWGMVQMTHDLPT
jgi:hypothetical protein